MWRDGDGRGQAVVRLVGVGVLRYRPPMARLVLGIGVVWGLSLAGCTDPCVTLAERICNCEPTAADRRSCVNNRITNQQGNVVISDADRSVCTAALDTCTCAALDVNDLSACGYAPAGDE